MPQIATDPAVSERQRRAMWAAREGRSELGIPKEVGEEYTKHEKPVGKDSGPDFMATMEQFAEAILEWAHEETRESEHSDEPRQGAPGEADVTSDNVGRVRADGTVAADAPRDRRLAQDPLTEKGERILNEMRDHYGSEEKAKSVFYASKNAGKISGVDQDAEDAIVYHGTRAGALQSIIDNGLMAQPNMHYHPDRFYQGERGESVYVAIDPVEAARWALEEVNDPGDATVLEIEVPQDSLVPDEQWSKAERHVGDIPPEAIMKAYLVNADGTLGPSVNLNRRPVNQGYTRWVGVTHASEDEPVVFGTNGADGGDRGGYDGRYEVAQDGTILDTITSQEFVRRDIERRLAMDEMPILRDRLKTPAKDPAGLAAFLGIAMDWRGCVQLQDAGRPSTMSFDRMSMREYSEDGHLHVKASRIAQARIDGYKGSEIPSDGKHELDPDKIYQLFRDPNELGRPETVESFKGKPILGEHLPISADAHAHDLVVGSVGSDVRWNPPFLEASLNFWPQEAIDDIESGRKKALSPAYHYSVDWSPGEFNGQHYDGVMRNLRFNHLALVRDGRQGDNIVVADSALEPDAWEIIASAVKGLGLDLP